MEFRGFHKDSFKFLQEIKQNNNKVWFEENKSRYQEVILEPCRSFVVEMGEHLQALVPFIKAQPKINGSLFRIYRDTRFSKDKTPMKTKIGIVFWQGVQKRTESSSFYFQFSPEEVFIAVGVRTFHCQLLKAYREHIKDEKNRERLHNILEDIKAKGYETSESHYKRYPKGFSKDDSYSYLSLFNTIHGAKSIKPNNEFFSLDIVDRAYKIYEDLFPLQQWLYELTLEVEY
ncbi:MAG: DUF2461 domain-containing protein [Campylobacterales bacterium]|nr:DUF2461 domain-containing protein [Campylobacterales bacterium]